MRNYSLSLLVLACLAQSVLGQSVPTTEEVVRLNPFEVVEQQDDSFTTNSVGSGSRLKLDLKDVPAAYSVINRSFIDALGINDLQEAASWAPGQTFFYNMNGGMAIFGEQGSYVSRGFTTAPGGANVNFSSGNGSMRNFYSNSTSNTDSYMVETFDFGRGPNSSLFGTAQAPTGAVAQGAGLSGVNSTQTKRTRFDGVRASIQLEFGSYGYKRQALDYNRPLTDRIGIRMNLVNSEAPGYLRHDLETVRGIHLTGTWRITDSTSLTIEGSNDKTTTHGAGANINENFSGWDGSTVFRGPIVGSMYPTNATAGSTSVANASYGTIELLGGSGLTFRGETSGVDRINNPNYYYNGAVGTIMNWQNFGVGRRADETSRVPVWSRFAPNGAYYLRTDGGTAANGQPVQFNTNAGGGFFGGSPVWMVMNGLPSDMFARAIENSKFTIPGRRDNWLTDWPQNTQRARDLQFSLSHRINENLFVEIGGDMNRIHTENRKNQNHNQPELDINMLLPNGQPNPNFLQTFVATPMQLESQWVAEQTIRGNIAYTLDRGNWGRYTFNLNANAQTREYHGNSHRIAMTLPGIDSRRWTATGSVLFQSYYDGDRAYHDPLEKGPVAFTEVDWSNPNNPVIQPTVQMQPRLVLRGGQAEAITNYLSQYLLLQSNASWLDNRIVVLGSVRRDFSKTYRISGVNTGDLPRGWDGNTEVYMPIWSGIQANTYQSAAGATGWDYYNFTYQPLNSAGNPVGQKQLATSRPRIPDPLGTGLQIADPRYTGVRPDGYTGVVGPYQAFRSDFSAPVSRTYANTYSFGITVRPLNWFSPFVNVSNQTIPPTFAEVDLENREKRIVTARGVDFGARVDLGNRFNFKYNYFINTRTNEAANNGVLSNINTLINANHWSDTETTSVNSRGVLPLPGNADYQESKNIGYEIELAGQPLPGLRITLNGSVSSRINELSKRYPLTKTYVLDPFNQGVFKQLLEDAGGSIDTTQKPLNNGQAISYAPGLAIATPIAGAMAGIDQQSAVNAYNSIWIQYDQIIRNDSANRNPSSKSANFFADYTLQRGTLRGLRLGAGFQWQGDRNVGHRGNDTIIDPANATRSIDDPTVDSNTQVFDKGAYNTQMNISYPYQLSNGNTVNLSLRINNPLNDQKILYGWNSRQPNGDLSKPNRVLMRANVARYPEPISFRFTASYSFGGSQRSTQ
jgi:hypothetical protein